MFDHISDFLVIPMGQSVRCFHFFQVLSLSKSQNFRGIPGVLLDRRLAREFMQVPRVHVPRTGGFLTDFADWAVLGGASPTGHPTAAQRNRSAESQCQSWLCCVGVIQGGFWPHILREELGLTVIFFRGWARGGCASGGSLPTGCACWRWLSWSRLEPATGVVSKQRKPPHRPARRKKGDRDPTNDRTQSIMCVSASFLVVVPS